MANTANLSKEERKKVKRAIRKERTQEHTKKTREYARGPLKQKVRKSARGQRKR